MLTFPKIKKILWAVDAFQPVNTELKNVAAAVTSFAKQNDARVRLAFVPGIRKFSAERTGDWIYHKPYLETAERNLKKIAALIKGVPTETILLTLDGKNPKSNEIDVLLDHARSWKADTVAVATHAKNALVKLFIGSFTEGLLRHSRVPLLVIGPKTKTPSKSDAKTLIYPTDFSRSSSALFFQTVKWAAAHNEHVVAVHGLTNAFLPAVLSDAHLLGGMYAPDTALNDYLVKKGQKALKALLAPFKNSGVKVIGEIYSDAGLISDVIVHAAKKHRAELIVMSTKSSAPARAGMGSVTKKVIRAASAPVLVLK